MLPLVVAALLAQVDAGPLSLPDQDGLDAGVTEASAGPEASTADAGADADAGVDLAAAAAGAPPDEPDRGRQTVVTGSRTERKAADAVVPTEVITRAQIEQLGVRDLSQLLQQQSAGVEMVYTNRG